MPSASIPTVRSSQEATMSHVTRTQRRAMLLALSLTAPAWAQTQPWKLPNGAVESRVLTCTLPQPLNRIAMDDFQYQQTTVIRCLRWWGVVFDPAQLTKRYYVAFWG